MNIILFNNVNDIVIYVYEIFIREDDRAKIKSS